MTRNHRRQNGRIAVTESKRAQGYQTLTTQVFTCIFLSQTRSEISVDSPFKISDLQDYFMEATFRAFWEQKVNVRVENGELSGHVCTFFYAISLLLSFSSWTYSLCYPNPQINAALSWLQKLGKSNQIIWLYYWIKQLKQERALYRLSFSKV